MEKKNIVVFCWIFGLLILAVVVCAVICLFLGKENIFDFTLIIIVLSILEVVSISFLASLHLDEKTRKFELLERASFSKNKNCEEKLAKIEQKEIYKIFCNTLVDL